MNPENKIIGKKIYSDFDQKIFSTISGDCNPIHLNKLVSRKLISGEPIVHGINLFLTALNFFLNYQHKIPSSFKITFKKPVLLNKVTYFLLNEYEKKIFVTGSNQEVLVSIKYDKLLSNYNEKNSKFFYSLDKLEKPFRNNFNKLSLNSVYKVLYGGDSKFIDTYYPFLKSKIGVYTVYEISLLSNIVGMQLPGLQSLFVGCDIDIRNQDNKTKPIFKIIDLDRRFKKIKSLYSGVNINSNIFAYQTPKNTNVSSCHNLKKTIEPNSVLKNKHAIIIGGSRGIGAYVAKILSLYGCDVTITYAFGKYEANKVINDINLNTNSNAYSIKFDVTTDNYTSINYKSFDHLYYFATPKIVSKSTKVFDKNRFKIFYNFYCNYFKKIALLFFKEKGNKLIYYPSTILINNFDSSFEEYIKAKKEGELSCKELIRKNKNIIIDRLAKVKTDQTLNIFGESGISPAKTALLIVNKVVESM